MSLRATFFILQLSILSGCTQTTKNEVLGTKRTKIVPEYAKGFELYAHENGDFEILLYNLEIEGDTLYHLSIQKEETPKIACLSTTHVAFLSKLMSLDRLCGVAFADRLKNRKAIDLVEQGLVKNISQSETVDTEQLLTLHPDYFLVYPFAGNQYEKLSKYGISIIPISEYLEQHPLGRAEWIKVFGVLSGKYDEACQHFDRLKKSYNHIAGQIANSPIEKPVVFTGSYDNGNWFVPSGRSFIAHLIADAGGHYLYKNTVSSGNLAIPFEVMYDQAFHADYMGEVLYTNTNPTMDELIRHDTRLKNIKPYTDKHLFYCNSSRTDYFGEGILEPDTMLLDLASIFRTLPTTGRATNKYFILAEK